MPPSGVGIVTSSRAVVVVGRRPSRRRSNPTGPAHRGTRPASPLTRRTGQVRATII